MKFYSEISAQKVRDLQVSSLNTEASISCSLMGWTLTSTNSISCWGPLSYSSYELAAFSSPSALWWLLWGCLYLRKCVLMCPHFLHFSSHRALLRLYSLSVGAWTNVPSAPALGTQTAFIPNEGLMNFLKGGDGPNWSWYVPSGRVDGAIGRSLVLPPCDSQTRPKWKSLLALTGQFTVY